MLLGYERYKATPHPVRKVSEKEALSTLRRAKREHKEDFNKRLSKNACDTLTATPYQPLLPYYLVANGGYLSDEYELLSYIDSVNETTDFYDYLKQEELLEHAPKGIVIAHCADGDMVLLLTNNSVIRFSHEEPESIDSWNSLAQFIFDAVTEESTM